MAAWPSTLPAPMLGSLSETAQDNVLRTPMDVGPDKVRRRTTANVRKLSFQMLMTETQRATLDTFYTTTTTGGADEFTYTHPITSTSYNARFVTPPSYTGDRFTGISTTIDIELLP